MWPGQTRTSTQIWIALYYIDLAPCKCWNLKWWLSILKILFKTYNYSLHPEILKNRCKILYHDHTLLVWNVKQMNLNFLPKSWFFLFVKIFTYFEQEFELHLLTGLFSSVDARAIRSFSAEIKSRTKSFFKYLLIFFKFIPTSFDKFFETGKFEEISHIVYLLYSNFIFESD